MTEPPKPRSAELIRLERLGTALGTLPRDGAVWQALEELLVSAALGDARRMAQDPDLPEDKRGFWSGASYALGDVWQELQDFQSGAWKAWPNVARMRDADGEE